MTTAMIIIATIGAVAILFLTGLALGLAGYEDKKTMEYRQKVDAIIERLGLGRPQEPEQEDP